MRSAHLSALGDTTRRSGVTPGPPTSLLDPGGRSVAVPEARGLTSPALLESVDQWSLTIPETQIPGGSRPANPPFVGVVHGVWTLHPRAVCRSQPAPARASSWTCVRTGAEGLSGGNWIIASVPPVRRGCRCG